MMNSATRPMGVALTAACILWGAACGASRSATYELATVDSPAAVFACAERWAREHRFDVEYRHERDRRLVISREKEDVTRSDPRFQKALDQLTIEVAGPGARTAPDLQVIARTYFEFWDRRGRTREQQSPSDEAGLLAQRLIDDCGSATEEDVGRNRGSR